MAVVEVEKLSQLHSRALPVAQQALPVAQQALPVAQQALLVVAQAHLRQQITQNFQTKAE